MKAKTRKAIIKRLKFTKKGIMRKPCGQNHYRAKKSGKAKRKSRKWVYVPGPLAKKLKKLLSY